MFDSIENSSCETDGQIKFGYMYTHTAKLHDSFASFMNLFISSGGQKLTVYSQKSTVSKLIVSGSYDKTPAKVRDVSPKSSVGLSF